MRLSSPVISKQVIKGLVEMGVDVIDVGLVSTPTFYYAVANGNYDGGLQVSASHNPKEYNGIKFVREEAKPVGLFNGLDKIRDLYIENNFAEADNGTIEKKEGVLADIVDYSMKFYDFNIGKFKIVADAANAMSIPDLEAFFDKLSCELVKMNFTLDGTFPVHQADPFKPENVVDLKKKVIEEKADLGIATDGDGDRIFFIDNNGEMIDPAIIRGMLAKEVLKHNPGATICYDIRPGMITKDMIVENGGTPHVTKVGHSLIKAKAIELDSPFAGESSGHFFFKTNVGFFETPLIVTLIILNEMTKEGKPISEIVAPLNKYFHSGEINSTVEDKEGVMKKLEELYRVGAKNVSKLDGVSIEHEDYWFNVRASNTEQLLRLNLEARTNEKMEKMRDEILAVIRN